MFSLMESKVDYGAGGAGAAGAAAAAVAAPYVRSRESLINQHVPVQMSYTQMLRMSMEEDGAEDMGSSINNSSREAFCNYMQGAAMEVKLQERGEEGYAESDYDLTCLTLGLGSRPACYRTSPNVEPVQGSSPAGHVAGRSNSGGYSRTCTLCGTSKTPLWRSGPMGAKSLCNACGIRSKKAKKVEASLNDDERTATNFIQKKSSASKQVPPGAAAKMKAAKRKMTMPKGEFEMVKKKKPQTPQLFDNVCSPVKTETSSCLTSPGTPSPCSTQRKPFPSASSLLFSHGDVDALFPQDEEQAAFLLMALSCGLVLAN
ncbi:hypothetical protein L7F22_055096 [Adiantum nelumboides]|nr:hypothetical protein [Adiantum nelumboides]